MEAPERALAAGVGEHSRYLRAKAVVGRQCALPGGVEERVVRDALPEEEGEAGREGVGVDRDGGSRGGAARHRLGEIEKLRGLEHRAERQLDGPGKVDGRLPGLKVRQEALALGSRERAAKEAAADLRDERRRARRREVRRRPVGAPRQGGDRGRVHRGGLPVEICDGLVARDEDVRRLLGLRGVVEAGYGHVRRELGQRRGERRKEVSQRVQVLRIAHSPEREGPMPGAVATAGPPGAAAEPSTLGEAASPALHPAYRPAARRRGASRACDA